MVWKNNRSKKLEKKKNYIYSINEKFMPTNKPSDIWNEAVSAKQRRDGPFQNASLFLLSLVVAVYRLSIAFAFFSET